MMVFLTVVRSLIRSIDDAIVEEKQELYRFSEISETQRAREELALRYIWETGDEGAGSG